MKKYLVRSWLVFALFLSLSYVGTLAYAAPKAQYATLDMQTAVIDMAKGKTLQLKASVFPETANQAVEWKTGNKAIATISSSGKVTAKSLGKVYIYVRPKGISKLARCTITVKDSSIPTSIAVSDKSYKLRVGQTITASASAVPETASQSLVWKSNKPSIASVSSEGVIMARKDGKAQIRVTSARSSKVYAIINVTVAKLPAPTKITITPEDKTINIGEKLNLTATVAPSTAANGVKWTTSDSRIASVSSTGVVTAKKVGTVKITAISTAKSSVKTVRTLSVLDPYTLRGLSIDQSDLFVSIGDRVPLTVTLKPATAVCTVLWKSSNSSVVSISKSGVIKAKSSGAVTIEAKSDNGKFSGKITVAVIDTNYATAEPSRTTPVSGLSVNLAKIDAIRDSTHRELLALVSRDTISSSEANVRKQAIDNAFSMYRFPWMTKVRQSYWSTSVASKSYQPNVLYYGMPYIQKGKNGNDANRRYNLQKALNEKFFTRTGDYYTMNQSKKLNSLYVGSDCSSFLSMSIWGLNHKASFLRTYNMINSQFYRTVKGANNMLPGDTLVKSGDHTVMFLYYTNSAQTHMMIIEQGGGTEPNTIAARHKSVARYLSGGYVIRRPISYK